MLFEKIFCILTLRFIVFLVCLRREMVKSTYAWRDAGDAFVSWRFTHPDCSLDHPRAQELIRKEKETRKQFEHAHRFVLKKAS